MGFCSKCGTKLADGAVFCSKCGAPQTSEGTATPLSGGAAAGGGGKKGAAAAAALASSSSNNNSTDHSATVEFSPILEELKRLYKSKILPLEKLYSFDEFHSPSLTDTDFESKPVVLLLGQYSTGKTSFIRYLLEREFPGAHIGPEPTTDRFVAVMAGKEERTIPGNALAADASKPFTALTKFGMSFLNKFEGSQCPAPLLDKLIFVDTPGVLAGEKQRLGRAYNFSEIIEWFAERADRILLLFDAHKLDISDEFKGAIESLRGHDDKIRVVLNKADMDMQHLMRVYGALMWSLGKVVRTPEVPRVYVGSFWDQPLKYTDNVKLLQAEQRDLLADLRSLPRNSAIRKINELVKRARMCKVHAHIINHLRNQFGIFGKEKKQQKLLNNLSDEFKSVQREANLPAGDFPNPQRFAELLGKYEIHKFPKLDKKMIAAMDEVLSVDIPRLMRMLPNAPDTDKMLAKLEGGMNSARGEGKADESANPFAFNPDTDAMIQTNWAITNGMKKTYDIEFFALDLTPDQKVSGANAKKAFLKSKLSNAQLRQVWELSDCDKDGFLDADEFAVASYIMEKLVSKEWIETPSVLPDDVIPPSKRKPKEF